jgi:NADH-quinone oxidoreductase subunit L
MFLGVGVLGAFGAVFHLFTHAFFKALLFLTAGSVMHALSGQLDMRKMSGLARKMPVTAVLMLAGCLALAGFPLLAGFWSKDQILYSALNTYPLLGWIGVITALITAFYTFRLWFRVFMGPTEYQMGREHHGYEMDHAPDDHHHGPHEMPWLMNGPLVVLALGAILAGLFGGWIQSSVQTASPGIAMQAVVHDSDHAKPAADQGRAPGYGNDHEPTAEAQKNDKHEAAHAATPVGLLNAPKHKGEPGYTSHLQVGLVSGIGAIVMILLAGYFHWLRRDAAEKVVNAVKPVFLLLNRKYFVDELYHWTVVQPLRGIGWVGFKIIDGLLLDRLIYDGLARFLPWLTAEAQSPTLRGRLQGYALMMGLGVLLVIAVVAYAVLI